jgi:hypothetical protein
MAAIRALKKNNSPTLLVFAPVYGVTSGAIRGDDFLPAA